MKYVRVFNISSGNEKIMSTFDYFKGRIFSEMNDAYDTVKNFPYIGTVKDGSRLKFAQELEYILNNILVESENWQDYVLKFTTKRKNEVNSFIDSKPLDICICRCIGIRQANLLCENIIYEINKYAYAKDAFSL